MVAEDDVIDTIQLRPDAAVIKSLGANHTFESAIADLVDNSLDAGADRVVIRLLTKNYRLHQVEVVDNGIGMDAERSDQALTLGLQRDYGQKELGHFGVGLKAASLSHSDVLTMWSTMADATPVGRRIRRADFTKDFSCERLSTDAATRQQNRRRRMIGTPIGTTIIWSSLRSSYRGASSDEARTWISKAEWQLRASLGVTFHRLIEKNVLSIEIVVDELEFADNAVGTSVRAVDPFGYPSSGRASYPQALSATCDSVKVSLECHIWPGKTDIPGFRILGEPGEKFQGFFIYRNDRLLQVGGWSDVANPSRRRQLARVVIDDVAVIGTMLTMNPEKSGLRFEPRFRDALARACSNDGLTFEQFLNDAEDAYKLANKRAMKRQPVISPNRGFAPAIRAKIGSELGLRSDQMEVRWTKLPKGQFFDVDFGNSTLLLNQRYRQLLVPNGGSLNDAPLLKSLLFLLTHQIFEGSYLGSKDKDNIALWRAILGTAVEVEAKMRGAD